MEHAGHPHVFIKYTETPEEESTHMPTMLSAWHASWCVMRASSGLRKILLSSKQMSMLNWYLELPNKKSSYFAKFLITWLRKVYRNVCKSYEFSFTGTMPVES